MAVLSDDLGIHLYSHYMTSPVIAVLPDDEYVRICHYMTSPVMVVLPNDLGIHLYVII